MNSELKQISCWTITAQNELESFWTNYSNCIHTNASNGQTLTTPLYENNAIQAVGNYTTILSIRPDSDPWVKKYCGKNLAML